MALPNWVAGARYTVISITWQAADGTAKNLSGSTLSGTIQTAAGVSRAIAGTLTITSAAAGVFSWTLAAADVAASGNFLVQFKATYGSVYDLSFAEPWKVEVAL